MMELSLPREESTVGIPAFEPERQPSGSSASDSPYRSGEVEIGSAKWVELNDRRALLIDKLYTPGSSLTADEQAEFDHLQALTGDAVERAFPRRRLTPEEAALLGGTDAGRTGP